MTALDAKLPLEESLIAIVMAMREQFSQGLLKVLWWTATEDMLADALTKGAIKREPLLLALGDGRWFPAKGVQRGELPSGCTPARD